MTCSRACAACTAACARCRPTGCSAQSQAADRAALRLNALRPQARLQLLARRQDEALRRLHAAWRNRAERERARLRHADAVLRAAHPRRRLLQLRERLAAARTATAGAASRGACGHEALRLRGLARSLEAVSPLATVARGYSIIRHDSTVGWCAACWTRHRATPWRHA